VEARGCARVEVFKDGKVEVLKKVRDPHIRIRPFRGVNGAI
jgi:hypothetical protein